MKYFLISLFLLCGSCEIAAKEPPKESSTSKPVVTPSKTTSAPAPTQKKKKTTTALSVEVAAETLYPEASQKELRQSEIDACKDPDEEKQISCMIGRLYPEKKDAALAVGLYEKVGAVPGLEVAHTREVGYRGVIEFVPELPVGAYQKHLVWVADGFSEIDDLLRSFEAKAGKEVPYRWYDFQLKFYRTVKRKTPNAYAAPWEIAYNVVGSMYKSQRVVTETLFHEIFHMNDDQHGDWSEKALDETYQKILEKCAVKGKKLPDTKCLTPYSPGTVKVIGGTYYAFQPGNDVREYGAELALRYYQEQIAYFREDKKKPKAFKCINEVNASTWKLLVDEFFLGVDLVPDCEK